jgi:hypothetical protein
MKFEIAGKEFDIQSAKTKSVLEIEQKLNKSLAKIGDEFTFGDICTIVFIAMQQVDNQLTYEWFTDNTSISDMPVFNEVVAHFLAIPKS